MTYTYRCTIPSKCKCSKPEVIPFMISNFIEKGKDAGVVLDKWEESDPLSQNSIQKLANPKEIIPVTMHKG